MRIPNDYPGMGFEGIDAAVNTGAVGKLSGMWDKLAGFAGKYPFATGTMAAGIPLNLIGLFDNKKFGAQLGGAALGGAVSAGLGLSGLTSGANLAVAPIMGGVLGASIDAVRDSQARANAWATDNPDDYKELSGLYEALAGPKIFRRQLTPEEQARFNQLVQAQAQYQY